MLDMVLRRFLFLDTALVDDYLASIEGAVVTGTVDESSKQSTKKAGRAGVKLVDGSMESENARETKTQKTISGVARFQRLYDLLNEKSAIQSLDAYDKDIWAQVKRREVVEVEAMIRVPDLVLATQAVTDMTPWIELMSSIGQNPLADGETAEAINGMRSVAKMTETHPVPLLYHAMRTPEIRFASLLQRAYIREGVAGLRGEVTVFGVVQQLVPPGNSVEVWSLLPESVSTLPLNRHQRRAATAQGTAPAERLRGPGAIITPVALYI